MSKNTNLKDHFLSFTTIKSTFDWAHIEKQVKFEDV